MYVATCAAYISTCIFKGSLWRHGPLLKISCGSLKKILKHVLVLLNQIFFNVLHASLGMCYGYKDAKSKTLCKVVLQ